MAKIMIVDDSETFRSQIKGKLELAGFTVVEGEDGVDGLKQLGANEDVNLILCDINMPNLDGIGLCREIRSNPKYNKIPIFMLTTESNTDLKETGKSLGVIAWITKPCDEDGLVEALKQYLSVSRNGS